MVPKCPEIEFLMKIIDCLVSTAHELLFNNTQSVKYDELSFVNSSIRAPSMLEESARRMKPSGRSGYKQKEDTPAPTDDSNIIVNLNNEHN